MPWIGGDSVPSVSDRAAPVYAKHPYSYDTTNGLFPLDSTGTNFNQVGPADCSTAIGGIAKNNAITGNPAAVTGTVTILSLVQNASNTADSTITGTGTLTVSAGAIANMNRNRLQWSEVELRREYRLFVAGQRDGHPGFEQDHRQQRAGGEFELPLMGRTNSS